MDKYFVPCTALPWLEAWCKRWFPAAENQNDNKITTTNFTKTKPVNELAIAKEVQIVLDDVLDKITEKQSVNVATSDKRRGAVERKS